MKKVFLLFLVCSLGNALVAQDIHFSQFNFAPLIINPGNAGAEYDFRATTNYRNQWNSVASPYQTINAAVDMRFKEVGEGYLCGGINFYNDKAGDAKMGTTYGNLSLAYHLNIADNQKLGLGVMGGYGQRFVNTAGLMWGSQYDGYSYNGSLPTGEVTGGAFKKGFLDIGSGLVWTFQKSEKYITGNNQTGANIGFSVMHVHQPDVSLYGGQKEPLYRKYIFHGNGLIGLPNSKISFAPGFMLAFQGPSKEILFGSNVRYRLQEDSRYTGFISGASLSVGMWYRNGDAVSVTTLLQFSGYSLGFAYDLNVSDLALASNGKGGFEIALRYVYPNAGSVKKSGTTRFL